MRLTKEISPNQLHWRNEEAIFSTCRQANLISGTSQEQWFENIQTDPTIEMFGIEVEDPNVASTYGKMWINVGTCGFTSISREHGTAEYSMLIGPEHQGEGYGKLALGHLLDFGFSNWSWLNLVWGEIMSHNSAGLTIAQKLGFKEEARLRDRYFKRGERIDSIIVSLTREEYGGWS